MLGPMTFIVIIGIVLLAALAFFVLGRAGKAAGEPCPKCRTRNRSDARFCAHCGENLY